MADDGKQQHDHDALHRALNNMFDGSQKKMVESQISDIGNFIDLSMMGDVMVKEWKTSLLWDETEKLPENVTYLKNGERGKILQVKTDGQNGWDYYLQVGEDKRSVTIEQLGLPNEKITLQFKKSGEIRGFPFWKERKGTRLYADNEFVIKVCDGSIRTSCREGEAYQSVSNCKGVVPLKEITTDNDDFKRFTFHLMPRMDRDLEEWVDLRNDAVRLHDIAMLLHQLAVTLTCIEQPGKVYSDLKPENIVVNLTREGYIAKFGLIDIESIHGRRTSSFSPPERITNRGGGSSHEEEKTAVVFLFGAVAFYILTGVKRRVWWSGPII